MKSALRSLALLLVTLPLARAAGATTYMMMSDEALTDQASAIVDAKVVGVEPAPVVDGPPSTDYLVEIDRVLKGDLSGSTVVVRVPGGVNPLGLGLKIWGAPQFAEGENAILFLRPAQDGTYRILHLMLGAFHESSLNGRAVALRDLSEAHDVGSKSEEGVDAVRDFDRFSDWVADRARGISNEGGYVLGKAKADLGSAFEKFAFLNGGDGTPVRWFRFDAGQSVEFRVNAAGQPGLGLQATIDAFKVALNAWNQDPGTNIQYVYGGTTGATGGLAHSDGINAIVFDDPYRDDPSEAVEGTFNCGVGGVIAMGGPWFYSSTRSYQGKRYHEAAEADIVTNDGTECFFQNNPSAAQEVFAHELGHTLGLGHSADRNALMYAKAHNDGRGAQLTDDDRNAVAVLYGNGTVSNPGGGASLAAPARLRAHATKSTEVVLTWRDKAAGEDSYRIEVRQRGRAWREVLSVDANSTSAVVPGLLPGTLYSFRIRAASGGRFSAYSNVASLTTPR